MDIQTIHEKIQQLRLLREEIQSMAMPQMEDTTKIVPMYHTFEGICLQKDQEATSRANKCLFIAAVIMLYSPMSFVGRRIPKGVRTPLAKAMMYNTSEAISVAVKKVVSDYRIYSKFRGEVDELAQSLADYINSTSE